MNNQTIINFRRLFWYMLTFSVHFLNAKRNNILLEMKENRCRLPLFYPFVLYLKSYEFLTVLKSNDNVRFRDSYELRTP